MAHTALASEAHLQFERRTPRIVNNQAFAAYKTTSIRLLILTKAAIYFHSVFQTYITLHTSFSTSPPSRPASPSTYE